MTAARVIFAVGAIAGSVALAIVGGPFDLRSSLGSTALLEVGGDVASACIPDTGERPSPSDETKP